MNSHLQKLTIHWTTSVDPQDNEQQPVKEKKYSLYRQSRIFKLTFTYLLAYPDSTMHYF